MFVYNIWNNIFLVVDIVFWRVVDVWNFKGLLENIIIDIDLLKIFYESICNWIIMLWF